MFCPICKYEFIEGISECPDCNIQLIESLPKEEIATYEYVDLVTVLVASDLGEIAIVKSLLEEAEIKYFAKNENTSNLFGLRGIGFLSVQIQVSKNDEDVARLILKDLL